MRGGAPMPVFRLAGRSPEGQQRMISGRNPMQDRVAIAGAATTGFQPRNTDRSQASYVAQACKAVLDQCGLTPRDVDGLCGSLPALRRCSPCWVSRR